MPYIISSGESSSGIELTNDSMTVLDGGIAMTTTVANKTARLTVSSGGLAVGTLVDIRGIVEVFSDGMAYATMIGDPWFFGLSGSLIIYSGGYAINTTVNCGRKNSCTVSSGGTAINTTVIGDQTSPITGSRLNGGTLNIEKGGTALGLVVSSGGFAYDYGLISGASVYGRAEIEGKGIADQVTVSCGNMYVKYGGLAKNTSVTGNRETGSSGIIGIGANGTAVSTTVDNCGVIVVSSGGTAKETFVNSSGSMVMDGGFISNTIVSGGSLIISSIARLKGGLHYQGGVISAAEGATLDFDLTGAAPDYRAMINKLSVVQGTPNYTVTVSEDQQEGFYLLAEDAASFDQTITVSNDVGTELGTLTVDYSFVNEDTSYSLLRSNGMLFLRVGSNETSSQYTSSGCIVCQGQRVRVVDQVYYDTLLVSRGVFHVSSNGIADHTINAAYSWMSVVSGGIARNTTVRDHGRLDFSLDGSGSNTTIDDGGTVIVSEGCTVENTTVNKGGQFHIFSGGIANLVTVNSGGSLSLSAGVAATDVNIASGAHLDLILAPNTNIAGTYGGSAFGINDGVLSDIALESCYLFVKEGGTADHVTLAGDGIFCVLSGGIADNAVIDQGCSMFVSAGAKANGIVENGGFVKVQVGADATFAKNTISGLSLDNGNSATIHEGTTVNGVTVGPSGCLHVFSGGRLTGQMSFADDAVVSAYDGANIVFDISGTAPGATVQIGNLKSVQGSPAYSLTVSDMQTRGTYLLADGAASFDKTITVRNVLGESLGTLSVGRTLDVGEDSFALSLDDETLVLCVRAAGQADLIAPTVSNIQASITTLTDQDVILSADFADDVELACALYKIGETGEWTAYADGVTVTENTTVYFKAIDATGNESEAASYTVGNIDKAAPGDPTGLKAFVDGQDVALVWNASTDDFSGVREYVVTYSLGGQEVTVRTNNTNYVLSNADSGSYAWSVQAVDFAGNESAVTAGDAFKVSEFKPYTVEYSTDNFEHVIRFTVTTPTLDSFRMPAGIYQLRVRQEGSSEWMTGDSIEATEFDDTPQLIKSDADGNADVFFANAVSTWEFGYVAQHVGSVNDWTGTDESISVHGKNKLADIFEGSDDANVLLLTDDANGDGLFVDDIYTASPGDIAETQARIAQIDEIRAGAGDDIVDMTSQRCEYTGDGLTIRGGDGDDVIWANKGDNMLFGDDGNDRIVGASGDDVIAGGIGNDRMHGGGGDDVFTFCDNWGADTVEQLEDGFVTLWFVSGSESNWNAETLTYTDGENSVTVSGVAADKIALKFGSGETDADQFASLSAMGAFDAFSSRRVFEESGTGILASL